MRFGRTELIIGVSEAKHGEESAGVVRFGVGLPKLNKNHATRSIFHSFYGFCFFVVFLSAKRRTELKL